MKVREALQILRSAGYTLDRQKGSHQTWIGPNGEKRTLVVHSGRNEEMSPGQTREIRGIAQAQTVTARRGAA